MQIQISGITWAQRYQLEKLLAVMMNAGATYTPVWVAFHCDEGFTPDIEVDGNNLDTEGRPVIDESPDALSRGKGVLRSIPGLGETVLILSG